MTSSSAANAYATEEDEGPTVIKLEYDGVEARRFLCLIDKTASHFTLQTFDDVSPKNAKDDSLARTLHLGAANSELLRLYGKGAGVYLTINKTDGSGRRKSNNIVSIRAVWQEDDDGYQGEFTLEPSIVVETSPEHFHRYWLVADVWRADDEGRKDFASVMARMVETYGCDNNAKDLARVLRLPGFKHRKHGAEPRMVRIVGGNEQRYTRAQILEAFPPIPKTNGSTKNGYANGRTKWAPRSEEGERVRDALSAIPSDDRDLWLQIGMALKSEFGDAGFDPFQAWAQRSAKYDDHDCRRVWASIKPEGGITIATLFYHA
jgi:hypothetical protein